MFRTTVTMGLVAVLILPLTVDAARLYMEPANTSVQHGDSEIIEIRVDVDQPAGECINVVDATLTFDDSILPVDTSVGRSILRFWVEEPTIDVDANTVSFAGGIPNGYCGRISGDPELTNIIAEVVVRSRSEVASSTTATIAFADSTTVYLNDGSGTIAPLETFGTTITLLPGTAELVTDPWRDRVQADATPPEPFGISLERSDDIFNGRYYIVFNTTDKQTGIAGYEVMEEPLSEQSLFRFGAASAPWVQARSPYVLKDQTLNSTIRVRAIDKAGNEYVATFVPDPSLRERQMGVIDWIILGGVSVIVLIGVLVLALYLRRRDEEVSVSSGNHDGRYE